MNKEDIQKRIEDAGALKWFHRFEVVKGNGVYTPRKLIVQCVQSR